MMKYSLIPYFLKKSFMITLILGVIAYGYIFNLGFSFTDELCALLFCIIYICYSFKFNSINKEMSQTFSILILFFIYSCLWGQNIYKAAFVDFIIISKPFLLFYVCYSLPINLNHKFKNNIKLLCITVSIICLFIGLSGMSTIRLIFQAESQMASTISILTLLYLYCSPQRQKDIIIAFLILSVGLLTTKSKFMGFYISYIFIFFLAKKINTNKIFCFRNILFTLILLSSILIATWEKIYNYVYTGGLSNENSAEMWARPALYMGMTDILKQHPMLGSGMGSYANYASSLYYSPLYYQLGFDKIWGLTPEAPTFASDTFFPALVQYGLIGIFLFFLFWKKRVKESKLYFKNFANSNINYKICILIYIFFIIESLADSTFTQNRGMFMMGLLGIILKNGKDTYYQHKKRTNNTDKSKAIIANNP